MRLIDADKLIKHIEVEYQKFDSVYDTYEVLKDIKNEPTIDAVPVVRCKDCRFYETNSFQGKEFRLCGFGFPTRADDFCSWAWTGRKEE